MTTNTNPAPYTVEPVKGTAYATIRSETGASEMVKIEKTRIPNATARGGAYFDAWVVKARGRKFTERTRKAAIEAAVRSLKERGWNF